MDAGMVNLDPQLLHDGRRLITGDNVRRMQTMILLYQNARQSAEARITFTPSIGIQPTTTPHSSSYETPVTHVDRKKG
jgi:hypothetical protein